MAKNTEGAIKDAPKNQTVADVDVMIMDTAVKLGIDVLHPDGQADEQLNILTKGMWDAVHLGFQAGVASRIED